MFKQFEGEIQERPFPSNRTLVEIPIANLLWCGKFTTTVVLKTTALKKWKTV